MHEALQTQIRHLPHLPVQSENRDKSAQKLEKKVLQFQLTQKHFAHQLKSKNKVSYSMQPDSIS